MKILSRENFSPYGMRFGPLAILTMYISTHNGIGVICSPLVSAGRVCRLVIVGREQPGSPTPLLHCGKESGRGGRGLPHLSVNMMPCTITYHSVYHVRFVLQLVILVAYHTCTNYHTVGLRVCVSHSYQYVLLKYSPQKF